MFRRVAVSGGALRTSPCLFTPSYRHFKPHEPQAPPRTSADTQDAYRHDSFHNTMTVTENRFSSWFKRLWLLSSSSARHSGDGSLGASASTSSSSPRCAFSEGQMSPEEALKSMEGALVTDGRGRFPVTLVDAIWQTYDVVFPARLLNDLEANVTDVEATHFFSFLRILTEMNYHVAAVQALSDRLAAELRALTQNADGPADSKASVAGDARLERITQTCHELQCAASPLYYVWMRESAALENGVRRLMDFRKTVHFFDVLCKREIKHILKSGKAEATVPLPAPLPLSVWQDRHHDVKRVDRALTSLFHDFFRKEYLVMEELTWFGTPPALLEQIMAAESVQPFTNGLHDMKQRLQPTHHRHLFAFLHPAVVEEPLIAVQVALTKGVARSVNHLLGHPTPLLDPANQSYAAMRFKAYATSFQQDGGASVLNEKVDSAIFYSINSAQSALRGMDMGNMLIKRVVREVEDRVNTSRRTRGLETIRTFSTLSPIPGFVRWLASEVETLERQFNASVASSTSSSSMDLTRTIFGTRSAARHEECCRTLEKAVHSFITRHGVREQLDSCAARHPTTATGASAALVKEVRTLVDQVVASRTASSSSSSAPSPANTLLALRFTTALFQHPELFPMRTPATAAPMDQRTSWWWDPLFTTAIERPLLTSVAHYLHHAKKPDGRILDSVGNFHVSNGATMYRLNYLGNAGAQGSRESGCVMVNYWYRLDSISANVLQYDRTHTVDVHTHITSLLED